MRKMLTPRVKILVALTVFLVIILSVFFYVENSRSHPDLSRLALVGDSITQITSYPDQLQSLIGLNSTIGNFGASGSTVSLNSIEPYLTNCSMQLLQDFQPTTVVVMLGTNDARSDVYPFIDRFIDDYKELVFFLKSLESDPQIFLVIPPPIYDNNINLSSENFTLGIIPRIEEVAKELNLPIIDVYTHMLYHPDYFVDGVHPNHDGAKIIAEVIYSKIT